MRVSTETPLVYGSGGGSPPPSFELLTVGAEGRATYTAGNPWPVQPPFDEVGLYWMDVDPDTWPRLRGALATIDVGAELGPPPLDSGTEYLHWLSASGPLSARWVPGDVPPVLRDTVEDLRGLIGEVRSHPVRTLRGSVEASGGGVRLRLESGGREPFVLYGFAGPPEHRLEVRLAGDVAPEEIEDRSLPARMVHLDAVEVGAPADPIADASGLAQVRPGSSVSLDLPAVPGDGLIGCLVRISFPHVSVTGEPYVQEGWLMPEPMRMQ